VDVLAIGGLAERCGLDCEQNKSNIYDPGHVTDFNPAVSYDSDEYPIDGGPAPA
jgi:hypothetical protein